MNDWSGLSKMGLSKLNSFLFLFVPSSLKPRNVNGDDPNLFFNQFKEDPAFAGRGERQLSKGARLWNAGIISGELLPLITESVARDCTCNMVSVVFCPIFVVAVLGSTSIKYSSSFFSFFFSFF